MKCYLYHRVPINLTGNILYPLNQLKEKFPDLYRVNVSKYKWREFVKDRKIPFLDCFWNDVIHLTPVHPKEAYGEIRKYDESVPKIKFYKIPADMLDPQNTIIYLYQHKENKDKMNPDDFIPYSPEEVCKYSQFPQETKDYYKEMYKKGTLPLLWHKVPHIFYKGVIDTSDLEIIEV